MKTYKNILLLSLIFVSVIAEAQGQYGRGGMGRQRNTMPQTNTQEAPKPLTADEMVDQQMPGGYAKNYTRARRGAKSELN